MRRLGIIQPGRIGDIIICLPIAKFYFDKGYEIIWPIDEKYVSHFKNYIDYVKFIPSHLNVSHSLRECVRSECNNIIDLSFRFPGEFSRYNSLNFSQNNYNFDELKYEIANVPFSEKYNLVFTRNKNRELKLFDSLKIKNETYCVQHLQGSDSYIPKISNSLTTGLRVINIKEQTDSIFDWITVLENSKKLIMIDSCFANLCNQLKLNQKKYFINRPPPNVAPSITSDWIIYNEH